MVGVIFISARFGAGLAVASAVPAQPQQRCLPSVFCALSRDKWIDASEEMSPFKSLNSSVLCRKGGFVQLKKVSLQIQFYFSNSSVVSHSLLLNLWQVEWSVCPVFRGKKRLGWEVTTHRAEIWERLERGELFDTSEAAVRRKIWLMGYSNSRKGSFDSCRQRYRVPNSLKGRLARQNPARCCQEVRARLAWFVSPWLS